MEKIKILRKQKKESQADLAAILGVSVRTIQNYESKNSNVSRLKLQMIAKHYQVDLNSFYIEENEKKHDNESKIKENEYLLAIARLEGQLKESRRINDQMSEQFKKSLNGLVLLFQEWKSNIDDDSNAKKLQELEDQLDDVLTLLGKKAEKVNLENIRQQRLKDEEGSMKSVS